jgi:orotate phosphoribosyltransferase
MNAESMEKAQKEVWKEEKEFLMKEISLMLVKDNAIKFGEFTLTSGKKSPYYVDLRQIISEPAIMDWVSNSFVRIVSNEVGTENVDKVLGVPTAGIPFSTTVSQKLNLPLLYYRKEQKEHALKKRIEGKLNNGDRVLIVDDLITTGKSVIDAAEIIRQEGGKVNEAVVLLDREQGGVKNLEKTGIRVHCLFKMSDAIEWLHATGMLSDDEHKKLTEYIKKESTGVH